MTSGNRHWFALYTKPRNEFNAEKQLQSIGVKHFLPAIIKVKQWSDRKKKILEPLFRGYIFIYSDEKERLLTLELTSIVRCIFYNGKPARIPGIQIDNVKSMLKINTELDISNRLFPGNKVIIKSGPLKGIIGVVIDSDRGKSIAISVDLLNRSVLTRLPDESIVQAL